MHDVQGCDQVDVLGGSGQPVHGARNASAHHPWRLPTDAEWALAAQSGGVDGAVTMGWQAGADWYRANGGSRSRPVCDRPANAWGLCDMDGNVWEWVWGHYGLAFPEAGSSLAGGTHGASWVVPGFDWDWAVEIGRREARDRISSWRATAQLGFRLVRPVPLP